MPPTPIPYEAWAPVKGLTPLTESERVELAESLPVTPWFVIPYSGLRWGVDRAFVAGPIREPVAVISQHASQPDEPEFWGTDPRAAWSILSRIPGWFCVNGPTTEMRGLAEILEREIPVPYQWLGDMFYVLDGPPHPYSDPLVRLLGPEDIPLFRRSDPAMRGGGYRTYEELFERGAAAAAIVEDRIVALALSGAANPAFADVGVHTLEPYRRRGLSSAAVCLVAQELQRRGLTPIWSTGHTNLASQRVAQKVGFRPAGRGEYLVFEELKATGGYQPR
jgi:RimJ/RimL family protein N-acetyltransferase